MKLLAYIAALHAALLAILLAVAPAGSGTITLLGAGKTGAAAGCSQATTLLARYTAAGGSLSGGEATAMTAMVCGLVTDSIITGTLSGANGCGSVLDALYVPAVNNTTNALLNLCGTNFPLVIHNGAGVGITFTADVGYSGDGTGAFLDTQYIPASSGVNFGRDSASLGVYIQTNQTSADSCVIMGTTDPIPSSFTYMSPMNSGSLFTYDVNDFGFTSPANTTSKGAWIATRTLASAIALYKNGATTFSTASPASVNNSVLTSPVYIFALDNAGSASNFCNYQVSAFFISGGLTSTQAFAINNRINNYMTALGANHVY